MAGKSSDVMGAVSSLSDDDLPRALGFGETLRFLSAQREISLPGEAVQRFSEAVRKRIETSKQISLTKTDNCSIAVPAATVRVSGHSIRVPAYFRAPSVLSIDEVSPKGEAGTILPELAFTVSGAQNPVQGRLRIDGKPVVLGRTAAGFLHSPVESSKDLLAIGTHTADAFVSDSSGATASRSWFFTVGLYPADSPPIPSDAQSIGSFTVNQRLVFGPSAASGNLLVNIFQTKDGKRVLQYVLLDPKTGKPVVSTTELYSASRLVASRRRDYGVTITPASPYAFEGNEITLGYQYFGPGTIIANRWSISDLGAPEPVTGTDPTINWTMGTLLAYVDLFVTVQIGSETSEINGVKCQETIPVFENIYPNREVFLAERESGNYLVHVTRVVCNPTTEDPLPLIEGQSFAYPLGSPVGRLTVLRSRLVIAGETEGSVISNIGSDSAILRWKGFGPIEVVNEITLDFDYAGEHYSSLPRPQDSGLYGFYPFKLSASEKKPAGIIAETSRLFELKKIDLTINGITRTITHQGETFPTIDPPMVFCSSTVMPGSRPLQVNALAIVPVRMTATGAEPLPELNQLEISLSCRPSEGESGKLTMAVFGFAGDLYKAKTPEISAKKPVTKKVLAARAATRTNQRKPRPETWRERIFRASPNQRDDWLDFLVYARPIVHWTDIPAYPTPADLLEVTIKPAEAIIAIGDKTTFQASVKPKSGMGTGSLSALGGSLNLLGGYEFEKIASIPWNVNPVSSSSIPTPGPTPTPPPVLTLTGSGWDFLFEAKNGTGTFSIMAAPILLMKEIDTGSIGKVFGVGYATATVRPGLEFVSPVASAAYPTNVAIPLILRFPAPADSYDQVTWKLDGQTFPPETGSPPTMILSKPGSYTIEATFKVGVVELKAQTTFNVKPVSVSISPVRKLLPYTDNASISYSLAISLNDHVVTKPGQQVPWDSSGRVAEVEAVKWMTFENSQNGQPLDTHNDPLNTTVSFMGQGAVTTLATVTVRITGKAKGTPKRITESFVLQAVRADAWAIAAPKWNPYSGRHPKEGIASAPRTFTIVAGLFMVGNKPCSWEVDKQFNQIEIKPGLTSAESLIQPVTVQNVEMHWKTDNNQSADNIPSFTPVLALKTIVSLNAELSCGTDGNIPFQATHMEVVGFPLESVAHFEINPSSFTVLVEEKKTLSWKLNGHDATDTAGIYILENQFEIWCNNTTWSPPIVIGTQNRKKDGEIHVFQAANPGVYQIQATGSIQVLELDLEKKGKKIRGASTVLEMGASGKARVLEIMPVLNISTTDLDGTVDDDKEDIPGAYIHDNIDNDNLNTNPSGESIADKEETNVQDENDLQFAQIDFSPASLTTGEIVLKRSNDNIRVWGMREKLATCSVLTTNDQTTWDLSVSSQTTAFNKLSSQLWVEGYSSGIATLTIEYTNQGKVLASDTVVYNVVGANCGSQPTPLERVNNKRVFKFLKDCEWSITGSEDKYYNCIAWSVASPGSTPGVWYEDVRRPNIVYPPYYIIIDDPECWGNGDGILTASETDIFYFDKGFVPTGTCASDSDIMKYSEFHAAKKINCPAVAEKWVMFESKTGKGARLAHVWDQLNCAMYGNPARFYKRK